MRKGLDAFVSTTFPEAAGDHVRFRDQVGTEQVDLSVRLGSRWTLMRPLLLRPNMCCGRNQED